jgi:tetratricopeptide (TPR) repeat protein
MLPNRTREHELKTESERAFTQLLPSSWVPRFQGDNDYGIDADVEIFRHGQTTGSIFKVQLKGSDSTKKPGSRQIKLKSLTYWLSLDVPVIVVYYESVTGRLYGHWAHSHEPKLQRGSRSAKTTQFVFTDSSYLDPTSAAASLERDVEEYRAVRRGVLPNPLTYSIEFEEKCGRTALLKLAIRQVAESSSVDLRPAPSSEAFLKIVCRSDSIRIATPVDFASLVIHADLQVYDETTQAVFAGDILVGIAMLLMKLRASSVAAELFLMAGPKSSLLQLHEIAISAATCLAIERRYAEALSLGRDMFVDPEPAIRDAGALLVTPAIHNLPANDPPLGEDFLALEQRRVAIELQQGHLRRAGVASYNLAHLYLARREPELALAAFSEALEYDPGYERRAYFFRERAGLQWERRQYIDASTDYQRSLSLGGDHTELTPLLADALLFSGEYHLAAQELSGWNDENARLTRLVKIVKTVADLVRRTTGVDRQDRRPLTSAEVTRIGDPADPEVCWRYITEVDALEPRFWLEAASLIPPEDTLSACVLAAHTLNSVPEAWAAATAVAIQISYVDPLVPHLIDTGYLLVGDDYIGAIEDVAQQMTEGGKPEDAEVLRIMVRERSASVPIPHPEPVSRFIEAVDVDDDSEID